MRYSRLATSMRYLRVATATDTHADYIERAVAAGKPVLCEKPIDLSLARVNACAEKIKGANVVVQLGFNRRFDPGHRAAHDAVRAGEIGDLHQVVITSRDRGMPSRAYYRRPAGLSRALPFHTSDLPRLMLAEERGGSLPSGGRRTDP